MSARYTLLPVALVAGLVGNECVTTYSRVYTVAKYVKHRQGYQFDNAGINERARAALSLCGGLAGLVCTTVGTKWLVDRVLLSRRPDFSRLYDALSPADVAAPPLTPARVWALLGPRATSSTLRHFARVHGLPLISLFISLMAAIMVAPFVQINAECLVVPQGAPRAGVAAERRGGGGATGAAVLVGGNSGGGGGGGAGGSSGSSSGQTLR